MSAVATSLRRISRPSGACRLRVMLFTPRLFVSKYVLGKPGNTVDPRELSPTSGTSILMTSAPRSAISIYGTVPACAVEQATTFTPWSGPCVISNDLLSCNQAPMVRHHSPGRDPADFAGEVKGAKQTSV